VVRQAHHWAALIFVVAIVLHLMRVFFTGAFRKPRDSNWIIGLTLLTLALLEGFAGYSMPDDLLSGMGLAIGYGTALSIPGIGAQVAFLIWGGEFPGDSNFIARLYIAHVFIFPIIIGLLIGAHLAIIMRQKHSQFPGRGRTQRNVIGYALMPGYSLRAIGMLLATAAVIFLLGGLIQINPIWQYGPYEPWLGTNGAQPDWYMGWLIGALRLMPPIELHIGDVTFIPNPAWGGLLFPGVVFTLLYLWPWLERKITGDYRRHDLLDRPRDRPHRTALGIAFFSWIVIIFVAGAADRILVDFGIPYEAQVWWFRLLAVIGPIVVYGAALLVLKELKRSEVRPMRRWSGTVLRRSRSGEYEVVAVEDGHGDGDSPAGEGGGNGANGGGNGSGAGGGGDRPASEATDSERT
jgi:ubiquinol-cytochrome c reductase cytochrome b subunit